MLEVVGQDIISGNMGFIGTDPGREYQMGTAEKTEDVTVTGNPAVLDNATGKPFKDLHIYGRSEQKITNGYQLIDHEKINASGTTNGVTYTNNGDGSITVNGTATKNAVFEVAAVDLQPGTYRIRCDDFSDREKIYCAVLLSNSWANAFVNSTFTIQDETLVYIKLVVNEGNTARNLVARPLLSSGTGLHEFEAYTGGKPSPSPAYPQEIVSAGDGGSVAVKVTGKNLLDFLHAEITKAGWLGKFTRDEEILTISAVNGWNAYWFVSPVRGKQISVSFTYRQIDDKTFDNEQSLVVGTSAKNSYIETGVYSIKSPKKSWTKIACTMISETYVGVMLRVKNEGVNEERTIEIKDFQLELGTTATAYSPYREQLLTLPTPNGLPGVPVTSGGNYTDPQGQQWICDEVDLGRGVYVQRVDKGAFDATKALTEQSVILATPIETPLTAAEIAAYKSLRTYRGTTIVEAEDKAGISVTYKRNAKTGNVSAEKKIEESEKKEYDES